MSLYYEQSVGKRKKKERVRGEGRNVGAPLGVSPHQQFVYVCGEKLCEGRVSICVCMYFVKVLIKLLVELCANFSLFPTNS